MQSLSPPQAAFGLGFWSSLTVTLMVIVFPLSLVFASLQMAYTSSFLLAPAFVAMMVCLHQVAAPEKRVWSQLGLAFAIIYALLCTLTFHVQITAVQFNPLQLSPMVMQPFVFVPGTPYFAQDMLGYAFFCLATLAAAPVFRKEDRLEGWIRRLFLINGVFFTLPTLALPALAMPTNPAGTGLADQVALYANLAWSGLLAVAAGLVTIWFRRMQNAARQNRQPEKSITTQFESPGNL